ncbi:MAG: hypothetical protein ACK5K7_07385 [Bacilli bacterium]
MFKDSSILFALDNVSQLKYFKFAISTIPKENFDYFDLLILVNEDVIKNKEYLDISKKLLKDGVNLREIIIEHELPGMFY